MDKQNHGAFQKNGWRTAGIPHLRRGANLGNFLECAHEGDLTDGLLIQDEWFPLLKGAGFDFVRLPVRWAAHADANPPYRIEGAFLKRVTHLADAALESGLSVVVNQHHYVELMENPAAQRERFLALCRLIGGHFKGYPESLFFELVNEPTVNLTPALWNDYLKAAWRAAREADAARVLVVDAADWANIPGLELLSLSGLEGDYRLIVSFHYYEPHPFTHQGARWVKPPHPPGAHWTGSAEELAALRSDLDRAAAWGEKERRLLFLGEFGAYQKYNPLDEAAAWTKAVREEAEKRDIPWCFWEFCHDFGFWDRKKKAFKEKLLRALIP